MRELDALLLQYLEAGYLPAGQAERAAFARLLELPDPDLFGYLVGRTNAPEESLRMWPVSTEVNKVAADGPHLLRPIELPANLGLA